MFTARLKILLNNYVKSRQVNDDYESLFDLFISDKLKESLPPGLATANKVMAVH